MLPGIHPHRRGVLRLLPLLLALIQFGCASSMRSADVAPVTSVGADPPTLFLTWETDPTSTMVIQWLSQPPESDPPELEDGDHEGDVGDTNPDSPTDAPPRIWYAPENSNWWEAATGERHPFGPTEFDVNRIVLSGLEPGERYRFRFAPERPVHIFQTMPATLGESITFVAGGDAGAGESNRRTCAAAAARDPMFAILGGDIAYANATSVPAWVNFLTEWSEGMRAPDGRMIPMIVSIGNHEVAGGYDKTRNEAPLFLALFQKFKDDSYEALDFGEYLSLILLDSWHTTQIEGAQTEWLEESLQTRAQVPHLFIVYHMPAYPSHRDFDGRAGRIAMREQWTPLFEAHRVSAVFENDDHTYKRTPRLRGGEPDPTGILYLGDGCWGRAPRVAKDPAEHLYLEVTKSIVHFIETTIEPNVIRHVAIDMDGNAFDFCQSPVREIVVEDEDESDSTANGGT